MSKITDLERQIRELVNAPRKRQEIFNKPAVFNMMCACLDVIGDTEMAFQAHKEMQNEQNFGLSYLVVYGFMQALVLQQDAVRNLCHALEFPFELDPCLKEIRQNRNDAVGHPTNRDHGKSFIFINRSTLSNGGFQLIKHGRDRDYEYRRINLGNLLNIQRGQLEKVLEALVQTLWEDEMEHRQQFREEKLEDLFPKDIDFFIHKIFESIPGTSAKPWAFGGGFVQQFIDVVRKFKSALERRVGVGAYEMVEHRIKELEYPLEFLREYFETHGKGKLNDEDADIFTYFARQKLRELKDVARDIDFEYSRDPDHPAEIV